MLGLRVSALGSRGGATDHFPKRDRLPASPISSAQAAPGPCFLTGSRCHHEADGHGSQGAHQHSRIASFSPHRWDGGAVPDWFFKMSRSIRTVRSSRRKRPSSSRSSVVSAPAGPWPASIPACRTQARTALSVRPSSRATTPMDFPLSRINRTVSALNSSVNARRLRLAMEHSYRTFVRSAVSTKPGQLHRKLQEVQAELRRRMHTPIHAQHRWLCSVLRGHDAYYGLPSNWPRLDRFHDEVRRRWYRVLCRRSQRRLTWEQFNALLARFPLPSTRITHPREVSLARVG